MSEQREEVWTVHTFTWDEYQVKIYDAFPHDIFVTRKDCTVASLTRYVKGSLPFEVLKGLSEDALSQMEAIVTKKRFVTLEEQFATQKVAQLLTKALTTETFGNLKPEFPKSKSHLESCDPFNCTCDKQKP